MEYTEENRIKLANMVVDLMGMDDLICCVYEEILRGYEDYPEIFDEDSENYS